MCGICGKVTVNPQGINGEIIRKMTIALRHRGPDDEGVYLSETKGENSEIKAGLGHCRLNIIDLSSRGHQPMANEDETVWIVYNGEIYNFKELKNELTKKGHIFRSDTDTEVIIHLYEERGIECVKLLRGMFAFAIWDKKDGRLFLARDRLGKKPLNYIARNGSITFSSEIRPILEDMPAEREVNLESLHNYLTYQYVPHPETMFKGIKKLPPAHILTWDKGRIKIERYWNLSYAHKFKISEEECCERIFDLLAEATKIRMISDVPLGAFLSGGIDSSIVVALMSKCLSGPVRTFSIGFEDESFNELKYARIIADFFNTKHKEYIVRPKAMEVLPELVEHFGEPFADPSSISTYYLAKMTRSDVTVALSGDAGDEVFAGYDRYVANKLADYYRLIPSFIRNKIIASFLSRIPETSAKKDFARRAKRFIAVSSEPKEKRYLSWMSVFDDGLKMELYSSGLQNRLKDVDSSRYLLDIYRDSDAGNFIDSTLFVDTMSYLPCDLLVKTDITSMANSLEVRSPFLDHKLVEFAARIPVKFKLKGITPKYILRKAFKKTLPRQILRREKSGFGVPVGRWLRSELKSYAYEVLLSQASINRGYFKKEAIKRLLDQHVLGQFNHGERIWALLNLELWHRRFIGR